LELEGAKQKCRPGITWKEVIDKDMNDLQVDRRKWRAVMRGNLSNSSSDNDAES